MVRICYVFVWEVLRSMKLNIFIIFDIFKQSKKKSISVKDT